MIRGIRFKIPNKYFHPFEEMMLNINIEKYIWTIADNQVFKKGGEFLFTEDTYWGIDFKKIIIHNIYYVVFANIKAFFNKNDISEIKDFHDFMQSKCQMVIICCDAEFVEIYCKSFDDLEIIRRNALEHDYQDVEEITSENDQRIDFSAF
ncbi:MAG TPA: DUF2691 family protein [Clostridiales bacterium]|nr:DUF2691 family protein [Clostridiales bacterium]